MKPILLVAASCFAFVGPSVAATGPGAAEKQQTTAANLTDEQQFRILRAFGQRFPDLQRFAMHFPSAPFVVTRHGTEAAASTTGVASLGRFSVFVSFSGTFDPDFTSLKSAVFEQFSAHDLAVPMARSSARAPRRFSPEELGAFCDDPEAFLLKKFDVKPPATDKAKG